MTWSSDWLDAVVMPEPAAPQPGSWDPGDLQVVPPACAIAEEPLQAPTWEEELEAAYRQGFEDGASAATAAEHERLRGTYELLEKAAAFAASNAVPDDVLRDHVAALAVAVARHIIGREVSTQPHVVADLVRRALSHFPMDEHLRIRVQPRDLSALTTVTGADGAPIRIAPGREVQWVPDPQLESGECIVEGRRRIVDGRVDLALERMYRRLTDA